MIDNNQPLAGKDITFMVTLNNIREASADEILSGVPIENESSCGTNHGGGCGC